jgi:hypothetical protein
MTCPLRKPTATGFVVEGNPTGGTVPGVWSDELRKSIAAQILRNGGMHQTLSSIQRDLRAQHRKHALNIIAVGVREEIGGPASVKLAHPLSRYAERYVYNAAPLMAYHKDWAQFVEYYKEGLMERVMQTTDQHVSAYRINRIINNANLLKR